MRRVEGSTTIESTIAILEASRVHSSEWKQRAIENTGKYSIEDIVWSIWKHIENKILFWTNKVLA